MACGRLRGPAAAALCAVVAALLRGDAVRSYQPAAARANRAFRPDGRGGGSGVAPLSGAATCTVAAPPDAATFVSPSPEAGAAAVPNPSSPEQSPGFSQNSSRRRSTSRLLRDFATASGELVDPYAVLRVPRMADRAEVKAAFRKLSKRYHPDALIHRSDPDVLPGKCASAEDVWDEWERIKLSYEILSDKRTRLKYDIRSALADPGAALGRAAARGALWGLEVAATVLVRAGLMAAEVVFKIGASVGNFVFA